jgi:insertion element IS1 protein InsB
MWSFFGNTGNKMWLAIEVTTREMVGVFLEDRSRKGAQELWDALPAGYRQCAVPYTDFWPAYDEVFPRKRHQRVDRQTSQTSYEK